MSSTTRFRGPRVGFEMLIAAAAIANVAGVAGVVALAVAGGRTLAACLLAVLLLAADVPIVLGIRSWVRPGNIDDAAKYLAFKRHQMPQSSLDHARREAVRLGHADLSVPGLFLGETVRGKHGIWTTWEDIYVEISGPQTGKTSARAIPNIVTAPGPVMVTACKREIMDATRGVREHRGRTWVFDPQNLAGEPPSWYWSPLSMVGGDLKDAKTVAGLFMYTQRKAHMQTDAYFEPAAQSLIALLLFAAEAGDRPITDIYRWLSRPLDETPLNILQDANYGLALPSYEGMRDLPAEQRAGVYGAALRYMSWLAVPELAKWITPGEGREEFPFVQFTRESTDTLYVLSRSEDSTVAPVASCLTAAVVVVGETGSAKMPGGRLRVPLLTVLDDPSNVAQLQLWPNRFSHFGSRGVIVMMMLQSWAQGVDVWGADGMAKLWGAASVRVCGGGASERSVLADTSKLAGQFEAPTVSTSRSVHEMFGSVSHGVRRDAILHPSDVSNLPRDRMLVQVSGQRPMLARSIPWTEHEYADDIRASIAKYGRRAQR